MLIPPNQPERWQLETGLAIVALCSQLPCALSHASFFNFGLRASQSTCSVRVDENGGKRLDHHCLPRSGLEKGG